jgi:dihydrofolate synthase/folylpolyglutamate synthase
MHLRTPHAHYDDLHVALPGQHQQTNAVLAVRAAELALPNATPDAVAAGLHDVHRLAGLRGRLQMLHEDPFVLADVAHNPSSLGATLGTVIPNVDGRLVVALSLAQDKDLSAIGQILARHAAHVVPLHVDSPRARPAADLAEQLRAHGVDTAEPATVRDAVNRFLAHAAPPDALLLTGSHTVVAPALPLFNASDHA